MAQKPLNIGAPNSLSRGPANFSVKKIYMTAEAFCMQKPKNLKHPMFLGIEGAFKK